MDWSQVGILLTGVVAIFLTQSKTDRLRKWASVFGLIGQPFWMFSAYQAHQWGALVLTLFYTFAWAKGFYQNWLRPLSL